MDVDLREIASVLHRKFEKMELKTQLADRPYLPVTLGNISLGQQKCCKYH